MILLQKKFTVLAMVTCYAFMLNVQVEAKTTKTTLIPSQRVTESKSVSGKASNKRALAKIHGANEKQSKILQQGVTKAILEMDSPKAKPELSLPVLQDEFNKGNKGSVIQPKTAVKKEIALPSNYKDIGIFGEAIATKEQAILFLKTTNADNFYLDCTPEEIVEFYWQEAGREGVRQDLAFSQALVETGFFRFGGDVHPKQNNFCGLGSTGGGTKGAHFSTPEIGVRAHIQHLLAYTTQKHPSTKIVDPRYQMAHAIRLERGLCDTWYKLNGTWAMGPNYSEKIMRVYQRMLAIEVPKKKEESPKEHNKKEQAYEHKMRDRINALLREQ